ncbi:uncharacterized protein MONBRDRAFT_33663 [Monosiga brevicollis MX1]|uniref:diphthine methyl ester synthase n=1 Tax=Monosiga brevicollis TaxID=81824 RepID=A9V6F4_MONBE|nr:uncharacterized protein MONBRDRAFT_33663 [Monosiga brevicollis MX1]EDQ86874.1 predicted protein [Monosiga brevicollis MX1]|eukprot:XP_001748419.1 hypothetical protein [Monosiga brevicollis MX1]
MCCQTFMCSLSLSLSQTLSNSLSLSQTLSQTLKLSLSQTLKLSLKLSNSLSLKLSNSLSLKLSNSQTLSLSPFAAGGAGTGRMFYLIGLGLSDEKDITARGLEIVKRCDEVFLEAYTAILMVNSDKLEAFYGRPVTVADRELVEQQCEERLLLPAKEKDIALLVVGDPFAATTHTDLVTRCKSLGVPCQAVHNASIMNAIGCCGLQLYNFGRTVSIVFFTEQWRPDSFYAKMKANKDMGLHTLCLVDIKVKEQSIENLIKGRKIFEPPRYMTVNQCAKQLLEVEEKYGEGVCGPDSLAVGVARVGCTDQRIVFGTLSELVTVDFGPPLHSLVVIGETDEIEREVLDMYKIDDSTPRVAEEPDDLDVHCT